MSAFPVDKIKRCEKELKADFKNIKSLTVNLLIGPPEDGDTNKMLSLFFSEEGKHIICGGTTANIAAKFLNKPLLTTLDFEDEDIPPVLTLEGADLVTEGVITISKAAEYAKDYLYENKMGEAWRFKKDGASQICKILFEDAANVNFYVGRAINPVHQASDSPIKFSIKMNAVEELVKCLEFMGKKVKATYF